MGMDCKYCGAYISSDVDKCPACGKRVSKGAAKEYNYGFGTAAAQAYAEEPESQAYTYKEEYSRRYGEEEYKAYGHEEKTTAQNFRDKSEEYREKAKEYSEKAKVYTDKAEAFVRKAAEDKTEQHKLISYLSYFGLLFLVPYLLFKDDEFCRFHANQGLLLFIVNTVFNIVGEFWLIGGLIRIVGWIFTLVCFIRGLRSVYRGTMEPLPYIGSIKLL